MGISTRALCAWLGLILGVFLLAPLFSFAGVDRSADEMCTPFLAMCGCGEVLQGTTCVKVGDDTGLRSNGVNMNKCKCQSSLKPAGGTCRALNDCKGEWYKEKPDGEKITVSPNAEKNFAELMKNLPPLPQGGGGGGGGAAPTPMPTDTKPPVTSNSDLNDQLNASFDPETRSGEDLTKQIQSANNQDQWNKLLSPQPASGWNTIQPNESLMQNAFNSFGQPSSLQSSFPEGTQPNSVKTTAEPGGQGQMGLPTNTFAPQDGSLSEQARADQANTFSKPDTAPSWLDTVADYLGKGYDAFTNVAGQLFGINSADAQPSLQKTLRTGYAPGVGGPNGGWETSKANPEGLKNANGDPIPRTLVDVLNGDSKYVTLAGKSSEYGKTFDMGPVTFTNPVDGKTYTGDPAVAERGDAIYSPNLDRVRGHVHDLCNGCIAKNHYDIAVGDFRGWKQSDAVKFVSNQPYFGLQSGTWQQIDGIPQSSGSSFAANTPPVTTMGSDRSSYVAPGYSESTWNDFAAPQYSNWNASTPIVDTGSWNDFEAPANIPLASNDAPLFVAENPYAFTEQELAAHIDESVEDAAWKWVTKDGVIPMGGNIDDGPDSAIGEAARNDPELRERLRQASDAAKEAARNIIVDRPVILPQPQLVDRLAGAGLNDPDFDPIGNSSDFPTRVADATPSDGYDPSYVQEQLDYPLYVGTVPDANTWNDLVPTVEQKTWNDFAAVPDGLTWNDAEPFVADPSPVTGPGFGPQETVEKLYDPAFIDDVLDYPIYVSTAPDSATWNDFNAPDDLPVNTDDVKPTDIAGLADDTSFYGPQDQAEVEAAQKEFAERIEAAKKEDQRLADEGNQPPFTDVADPEELLAKTNEQIEKLQQDKQRLVSEKAALDKRVAQLQDLKKDTAEGKNELAKIQSALKESSKALLLQSKPDEKGAARIEAGRVAAADLKETALAIANNPEVSKSVRDSAASLANQIAVYQNSLAALEDKFSMRGAIAATAEGGRIAYGAAGLLNSADAISNAAGPLARASADVGTQMANITQSVSTLQGIGQQLAAGTPVSEAFSSQSLGDLSYPSAEPVLASQYPPALSGGSNADDFAYGSWDVLPEPVVVASAEPPPSAFDPSEPVPFDESFLPKPVIVDNSTWNDFVDTRLAGAGLNDPDFDPIGNSSDFPTRVADATPSDGYDPSYVQEQLDYPLYVGTVPDANTWNDLVPTVEQKTWNDFAAVPDGLTWNDAEPFVADPSPVTGPGFGPQETVEKLYDPAFIDDVLDYPIYVSTAPDSATWNDFVPEPTPTFADSQIPIPEGMSATGDDLTTQILQAERERVSEKLNAKGPEALTIGELKTALDEMDANAPSEDGEKYKEWESNHTELVRVYEDKTNAEVKRVEEKFKDCGANCLDRDEVTVALKNLEYNPPSPTRPLGDPDHKPSSLGWDNDTAFEELEARRADLDNQEAYVGVSSRGEQDITDIGDPWSKLEIDVPLADEDGVAEAGDDLTTQILQAERERVNEKFGRRGIEALTLKELDTAIDERYEELKKMERRGGYDNTDEYRDASAQLTDLSEQRTRAFEAETKRVNEKFAECGASCLTRDEADIALEDRRGMEPNTRLGSRSDDKFPNWESDVEALRSRRVELDEQEAYVGVSRPAAQDITSIDGPWSRLDLDTDEDGYLSTEIGGDLTKEVLLAERERVDQKLSNEGIETLTIGELETAIEAHLEHSPETPNGLPDNSEAYTEWAAKHEELKDRLASRQEAERERVDTNQSEVDVIPAPDEDEPIDIQEQILRAERERVNEKWSKEGLDALTRGELKTALDERERAPDTNFTKGKLSEEYLRWSRETSELSATLDQRTAEDAAIVEAKIAQEGVGSLTREQAQLALDERELADKSRRGTFAPYVEDEIASLQEHIARINDRELDTPDFVSMYDLTEAQRLIDGGALDSGFGMSGEEVASLFEKIEMTRLVDDGALASGFSLSNEEVARIYDQIEAERLLREGAFDSGPLPTKEQVQQTLDAAETKRLADDGALGQRMDPELESRLSVPSACFGGSVADCVEALGKDWKQERANIGKVVGCTPGSASCNTKILETIRQTGGFPVPLPPSRPSEENPFSAATNYKGDSIINFLKAAGAQSDRPYRAGLAEKYLGIPASSYKGTEQQNIDLLKALRATIR